LDYHFGGFAKISPELINFINYFEKKTGIPLEPVYTGKMLFALYDLITKNTFKPSQRIIAVHTGGLQGKRGFTR
jgi:1-aminocyclopropane-1-carboxylate deaminase